MRPMKSAPKDTDILVLGPTGWRRAYYVDCAWMRKPMTFEHRGVKYTLPAEDIADCWRTTCGHGDIELDEARGWKPAAQ